MRQFFSPKTGLDMEWDAAYYRLEDYLRALHVCNKIHQSQVILELLQAAADKHREIPDRSPTTLAIQECQEQMSQWFEQILERRDRFPPAGLLPLFLADAFERWPASFLTGTISMDFQKAIKENDLQANPDLQVSRMVPRPLDISPLLEDVFHDGWEKLDAGTALLACIAGGSIAAAVFFLVA